MSPPLLRLYGIAAAILVASLLLGGAVWSPLGTRSGGVGALLGGTAVLLIATGFFSFKEEHARIYARFAVGRFARAHSAEMVELMGWGALLIGVLALTDGVRGLI